MAAVACMLQSLPAAAAAAAVVCLAHRHQLLLLHWALLALLHLLWSVLLARP
jgi:hypothetical protein